MSKNWGGGGVGYPNRIPYFKTNFSTSALITFGARSFFALGKTDVLYFIGCLSVSTASTATYYYVLFRHCHMSPEGYNHS